MKAFSQQSAPENGLPASLGSLRSTATQMLEDMESHDVVIDRQNSLPMDTPHLQNVILIGHGELDVIDL